MARVRGETNNYNFVAGLHTEASPLTSPENIALTLVNADLEGSGRVRRRLGIDNELNGQTFTYTGKREVDIENGQAISNYEWRSVGGQGNRNFQVVQIGFSLYFFDLGFETLSSGEGLAGAEEGIVTVTSNQPELNLINFARGVSVTNEEFTFSTGKGFLFVASPHLQPIVVEYLEGQSPQFEVTAIDIEVRDFDGVESLEEPYLQDAFVLKDNERPATLTSNHIYNLRNQGWPKEAVLAARADGKEGTYYGDPIAWTKEGSLDGGLSLYPSNADIFQLGKMGNAVEPQNVGAYHPYGLKKHNLTTLAPRGHFIINAFERDRAQVARQNDVVNDVIQGNTFTEYTDLQLLQTIPNSYTGLQASPFLLSRPAAIAFFAGRVFYAGAVDADVNNTIWFSQLLTGVEKAGRCYQENDPTAEVINQPLDTDGGTIEISGIGRVFHMLPFSDALIIFASNGVWALRGGTDTGFTPTTFSVDFLSWVGPVSKSSIVATDSQILFWAEGGIYELSRSEKSLVLNNITEDTIDTLYLGIDPVGKLKAQGFYDRATKKTFWSYNSAPASTEDVDDTQYKFDRVLILDQKLGAFYEYSIAELVTSFGGIAISPFMCGMIPKSSIVLAPIEVALFEDAQILVEDGVELIETGNAQERSAASAVKALILRKIGTTYWFQFAEFKDTDFTDWAFFVGSSFGQLSGGDYSGEFIETGYMVEEDAAKDKQIKWLIFHFDRTEENFIVNGDDVDYDFPSSALVRVKFEWTDTATAGRWSNQYEAYKLTRDYWPDGAEPFDYSFTVVSTKQRIRGRGRSFQFEIQTSPGKDLSMLGWDAILTGRSSA